MDDLLIVIAIVSNNRTIRDLRVIFNSKRNTIQIMYASHDILHIRYFMSDYVSVHNFNRWMKR